MKQEKPLREISLLVTGLVIVGLVTAVIIATFRGGFPGKPPTTQTAFPTASAGEPATQVLSPYPEPLDFRTPTEIARQTAVQNGIILATRFPVTVPPMMTEPPVITGTTENNIYLQSSGMKLGLDTQNAWVGYLDRNRVDLYAGALLEDPSQGAIFLFVTIPNSGFMGLILTPTKHGGVRVVSEHNNRLTMISTDGTTYYFDVPARLFVKSLTEVVPSATPPATRTPFPPPSTPVTPLPTLNPYPAPAAPGTAMP